MGNQHSSFASFSVSSSPEVMLAMMGCMVVLGIEIGMQMDSGS